jgi:uncharacterized protein
MQYRNFGKLDWKVSALGFGCMRLPTVDPNPMSSNIVEDEAIKMIRYAIDNGVNYLDTAYKYHDGNSEIILGKALKNGYREKVKIATKSPMMFIKTADEFDSILDDQLKKLDVSMIDFYLFHGIGAGTWEIIKNQKLLERAEAALKARKIGHLGFSFHDNYKSFEEIVNGYDNWDFCQIQYNFMDTNNQAGTKGLKLAASKGIAVVVMEPLLGGKLAKPPEEIKELFKAENRKDTTADLALQWVWDQPEVSVVLSGMSSMKQVEENLKSASKSGVGTLKKADMKFIDKIEAIYKKRTAVPCTGCSYCMPCPNNVDIPGVFKAFNDAVMYDSLESTRGFYNFFFKPGTKADACIQCRVCEEKCPQKITISEWMPKVTEKFS